MAKMHIFLQNGVDNSLKLSGLTSNSDVYYYGTTQADNYLIPKATGLSGLNFYITNMQGNDTVVFPRDVKKYTGNFEVSSNATGDGSVIGAWTTSTAAGRYGTGVIGNVPILTDITNGAHIKISAIGSSDVIQFSDLKATMGTPTGSGLTVSGFSAYTSNIVASITSATTDEQKYTVKLTFSSAVEYMTDSGLPDASKFKLHFDATGGAVDTDIVASNAQKTSDTELILTFDINDKDGVGLSSAPATIATNLTDISVIFDTTNSTIVDAISLGGLSDATLISATGKTLGSLTHEVNPNTYSGNLNGVAKELLSASNISDKFKIYFDSNSNEDTNFNDPVPLNQKYSITNFAQGNGTDNIEFVDQDNSTTAPAYASDATKLPIEIADDETNITLRLNGSSIDPNLSIVLDNISQSYSFVDSISTLATQLTSAKGTFSYTKSPVVTGHADVDALNVLYLSGDFNGQVVYVNRTTSTVKDGYNATVTVNGNAMFPTTGTVDASKLADRLNFTGNTGLDNVTATAQDDIITFTAGSNTITGGAGNDSVTAGGTNIVADLGEGNDTITATATNSTITGSNGNDVIDVSGGTTNRNRVQITSSGDGNDSIKWTAAGTNDTLAFTAPGDYSNMTLTYTASNPDFIEVKDVTATTTLSSALVSGYISVLTASGATNAVDVVLKASSTTVNLANLTADVVNFVSGTDKLTVDATAQTGNVTVTGAAIATTINTGIGADSITGGAGVDTISSGAGDDIIVSTTANFVTTEVINGGTGTDTIKITDNSAGLTDALFQNKTGIEKLQYTVAVTTQAVLGQYAQAAGIHIIDISAGASSIDLSGATGYVDGVDVSISGSNGGDTIIGGGAALYVSDGSGADSIVGSTKADTILGGNGNNTITTNGGADIITGGTGNDTIIVTDPALTATDSASFDAVSGSDTLDIQTDGANFTGSTISNFDTITYNSTTVTSLVFSSSTFSGNTIALTDAGAAAENITIEGGSNTTVNLSNITASNVGTVTVNSQTGVTITDNATATSQMVDKIITTGTVVSTTLVESTANEARTVTVIGGGSISDSLNLTGSTMTTNALTLNLTGVESIVGATSNILALTSSTGLYVTGGSGADTITASNSGDTVISGGGVDSIVGGTGNDKIIISGVTALISTDTATFNGTSGTDTLEIQTNSENLVGSTVSNIDVISLGSGVTALTLGAAALSGNTVTIADTNSNSETITVTSIAATTTVNLTALTLSNIYAVTIDATAGAASTITVKPTETLGFTINTGANGDSVTGGAGADTITGGAGADTITGGAGNDSLTGGTGDDLFVLKNTSSTTTWTGGIDTITDYATAAQNTTTLSNAAITGLNGDALAFSNANLAALTGFSNAASAAYTTPTGTNGSTINAAGLVQAAGTPTYTGTTAQFGYNSTTGALYFDADGAGASASAIQVALIGTGFTLTATDIIIIA